MINSVTFATRLKEIMEYYDLTASAFSDEIDFNRSTISHLLSGRNKPSLDFVMKVLNRFPEVTVSWLLYGRGNFPSNIDQDKSEEMERKKSKMDLFQENIEEKDSIPLTSSIQKDLTFRSLDAKSPEKKIKKIVIFYTDSSFETYEN